MNRVDVGRPCAGMPPAGTPKVIYLERSILLLERVIMRRLSIPTNSRPDAVKVVRLGGMFTI